MGITHDEELLIRNRETPVTVAMLVSSLDEVAAALRVRDDRIAELEARIKVLERGPDAMIDDKPRRIPLSQFTEHFMTTQRTHYDNLLAKVAYQIEEFDLDDASKRILIEQNRAFLAADLERREREISALVARGLRDAAEPLH